MDSQPIQKPSYTIRRNSVITQEKHNESSEPKVQLGEGASRRVVISVEDLILACAEKQVKIGPQVKQEKAINIFQNALKNQLKLKLKIDLEKDSKAFTEFCNLLVDFKTQNIKNLRECLQYIKMIDTIKVKMAYSMGGHIDFDTRMKLNRDERNDLAKANCDTTYKLIIESINKYEDALSDLGLLSITDPLIFKIIWNNNLKKDNDQELNQPGDDDSQRIVNKDQEKIIELWTAMLCPEITSILLAQGGGVAFRLLCKDYNEIVLKHWTMNPSSILIKDSIYGWPLDLFKFYSINKSCKFHVQIKEKMELVSSEQVKENEARIEFAKKYKFKLCFVLNDKNECDAFTILFNHMYKIRKDISELYDLFKEYSKHIHAIKCFLHSVNSQVLHPNEEYVNNFCNTITNEFPQLFTGLEVILANEIKRFVL